MGNESSLETLLNLTEGLSLIEKVRLIERVVPQIERELTVKAAGPRKSLRGLWKGLDITDEDIAEARREMWAGFPRKDV